MKYQNLLNNHLLFIILLPVLVLLSLVIYKDYGISIDEESTRMHGLVSLNYICNLFFPNTVFEFQSNNIIPELSSYPYKQYGVFFELILIIVIEILFDLKNFGEIFYARHLLTNFLFISSLIFFYFTVLEIFKNRYFPILAVLILYTSPRIFAESFYNNKDIVFMSFFICATYFAIKFLNKFSYKNALFFALALTIAVNIRVIGIYLLLIFLIFSFLEILTKKKEEKYYKVFIFFLFAHLIFLFSFWPFLWESPLENIIYSLKSFSKYEWGLNVFYLGNFYLDEYLPWHYFYILFIATTSLFLTFIIFVGLLIVIFRFFKRFIKIDENKFNNDIWKSDKERNILFLFFSVFSPLFLIYLFDSIIYSGWRHLYFIFPSLIILGIYSIDYLKTVTRKKSFKKLLVFILVLIVVNNIYNLIRLHPYQYVYFNTFFEKRANDLFEIDYWGVANKQALIDIVNLNSTKDKIVVGVASFANLNLSKKMLSQKLKNKIIIAGQNYENTDFIFNNNYSEVNPKADNKYLIPSSYKKHFFLKKGEIIIYEIYKKDGTLK